MVFQEGALFDSLNVRDNVGYPTDGSGMYAMTKSISASKKP